MGSLLKIFMLHKQCGYKDKDVKSSFERACTPENVAELIEEFDRGMSMQRINDFYLRVNVAAQAMSGLLASDINADLHQEDCVDLSIAHADLLIKKVMEL